ncbi:MAG: hypothetical protein U0487_03895 [Patescibacteria group bacterium]
MYISLQDLLMIVGIISLAFVAGFLSWTLYEAARLLRNVNFIADMVRENVERAERLIEMLGDKLTSLSGYTGVMAKAGEKLVDYFMNQAMGGDDSGMRHAKKKSRKEMPSLSDLDEG